jgi:hypothetical protein
MPAVFKIVFSSSDTARSCSALGPTLRLADAQRLQRLNDVRWIRGPPVVETGKPSYGTSTIRDLIPYEFGGTVDLVLAPIGLSCRLELSSDWLTKDGAPASDAIASASSRRGNA